MIRGEERRTEGSKGAVGDNEKMEKKRGNGKQARRVVRTERRKKMKGYLV